jgi:hypothetical protein
LCHASDQVENHSLNLVVINFAGGGHLFSFPILELLAFIEGAA